MNQRLVDSSQKPYFYLFAVRRWLQTWLNLLALFINVSLVAIIVALRQSQAGLIGAGLVMAIRLSASMNQVSDPSNRFTKPLADARSPFYQVLQAYTELELAVVAVERIKALADLPPEESKDSNRSVIKPEEVQGEIEFSNVTVSYGSDLSPAIRNINFKLQKGSKTGIIGRTGGGKSTILLSLFRMLEAGEGSIKIDGQDINCIQARSLRNAMTIIPQSPRQFRSAPENGEKLEIHHNSDSSFTLVLQSY